MSFDSYSQPLRQTGQCAGPFWCVDEKDVSMTPGLEVKSQHWTQQKLAGPNDENFLKCFKYDKLLGKGKYGQVYLAQIRSTNKMVALKLPRNCMDIPGVDENLFYSTMHKFLKKDLPTSGELFEVKKMFTKEASIAQVLIEGPCSIDLFSPGDPYDIWTDEYMSTIGFELRQMKLHPGYNHMSHILDFRYNIGLPGSPPCIVMEPHADELKNGMFYINRNGTDETKWIHVAKQICQAVDYIHYMGFVHLDLKTQNILYDIDSTNQSYQIYISDFGFCEQLKYINPHYRCGTKGYQAPELLGIYNAITDFVAVDIYAVAKTILNIVYMSSDDKIQNSNEENQTYSKVDALIKESTIASRKQQYIELTGRIGASRPQLCLPFRPCYAGDVRLCYDEADMLDNEEESGSDEDESGSDEDESGSDEVNKQPSKRPRV
jgi:serine/threonine protein kinase